MLSKILCSFLLISFLFPGLCYADPPHDNRDLELGIAIGAIVVLAIVVLTVNRRPRPLPPPRPVGFDQTKKNSMNFKLVLTPNYGGMRLEF